MIGCSSAMKMTAGCRYSSRRYRAVKTTQAWRMIVMGA
jgi:hypothetical protein